VAEQLLDILPHPLYTLVAALERFGDLIRRHLPDGEPDGGRSITRRRKVTGRLS